MSETRKAPRVVLGPVARKLVEGFEGNKSEALDEAIQDLITRAENPAEPKDNQDWLRSEVASLRETIQRQSNLIKVLQDVVILEQRMTRIYVTSILSDSDEEQQEILEMAGEAVDELIGKSGEIDEREMDRLRSREEAADTAMRRELDRGTEELSEKREPELER